MFTLVVTETLRRGETVPTLITDVASLAVVVPLVDILQMPRGERLQAVAAGKLLLVVVLGGDVIQQRLLTLKVLATVRTGESYRLEMKF